MTEAVLSNMADKAVEGVQNYSPCIIHLQDFYVVELMIFVFQIDIISVIEIFRCESFINGTNTV